MPAFLFYSEETSATTLQYPSADAITRALTGASVGRHQESGRSGATWNYGNWIGPRPRITRIVQPRATGDGAGFFVTRVAWLYGWPEASNRIGADIGRLLLYYCENALETLSNTWTLPTLFPYVPAVNGPVAWWSSGDASNTRTRDEFPSGPASIFDATENAVGPTTRDTHPTTVGEAATDAGNSPLLEKVGLGIAIIGGVVLVSSLTRDAA